MTRYFEQRCQALAQISSDAEARIVLMSSVRHLLQVINYSLIEWLAASSPDPDLQPSQEVLSDLLAPSDGTLVDALECLLICAEQNGWTGVYRPLLSEIDDCDGCGVICADQPWTLHGLLRSLVEMRNRGGEGHGLPGDYNRSAEEAALRFVVKGLSPVTPRIVGNEIEIGPAGREVSARMLRAFSGNPVLVRKIQKINSASVRIQAQYYNERWALEKITYDAWNPFARFVEQSLPSLEIYPNSWGAQCYFPDRVTDVFVGREDERNEIVEWLNDEESRACLVFGDGGVGKTTLVVETIHRVLEESVHTEWRPKVVSFYTAKRLFFRVDGLAPVGAGHPHLMDLLVHLHILILGARPASNFYSKGVIAGAMALQDLLLTKVGIKKSEHLIVIDNAETLIESEEDRDNLGKALKEIGKRIGRILITSRRREILGADPIEVKPLSKIEAVKFLRERGDKKLKINAIKRASDGQLLGIVDELERRPLVLEAFLNALSDPASATIEKAKTKVLGLLQKDLGTFLFSDAWGRFSREIRNLMVLLTRVADVHDSQSFRICCDICRVPVQDAEKALAESSGIASIVHIDGGVNISFSRNFLDYCQGREGATSEMISAARSRYSQFISRARSFTGDRVLEAFRTPLARAAHKAAADGDIEGAEELYGQAILSDSSNGLLFDRFAYFLFHHKHDNLAARHNAQRATELLPSNGECWYTRGLIEARLGDTRAAEGSLSRAESLGVSSVRCALQLAWAYLKSKPRPQLALAERQLFALEATTGALPASSRERIEIKNISERLRSLRLREAHKSEN